jgi:hypothetical protein
MSVDGPRAAGGADDQIRSSDPENAAKPSSSVPPVPATDTVESHIKARLPERIGQFHVKGVLASGGMGTVYRAVLEHPRRTVDVEGNPFDWSDSSCASFCDQAGDLAK